MYKNSEMSTFWNGAECWTFKEKTLKDDNSNETIRDMTGVEKVEQFLRKQSS